MSAEMPPGAEGGSEGPSCSEAHNSQEHALTKQPPLLSPIQRCYRHLKVSSGCKFLFEHESVAGLSTCNHRLKRYISSAELGRRTGERLSRPCCDIPRILRLGFTDDADNRCAE